MPQPALVSLAIAGEFIAFFILGGIAPFAASGEKKSLAENVVAGFIVAHAAAEVVSIFGALAGMTLTNLDHNRYVSRPVPFFGGKEAVSE